MARISSDALLHFTSSAARITGILKENAFIPRYNLEKYRLGRRVFEAAFPLISFCDIPLSSLKDHISTYGYYGIGMARSWAEKKGLNPILYLRDGSTISSLMGTLFEGRLTDPVILNMQAYIKQYEGDFYRHGKWVRGVRFYHEREWRFVPDLDEGEGPVVLGKKEFMNRGIQSRYQKRLNRFRLEFEPADIKYIIVRTDREILSMVKALKRIEGKYDPDTVEIVTSRILTSEQILNDF